MRGTYILAVFLAAGATGSELPPQPRYDPGDTVDVVVIGRDGKFTDKWVKAIVLGNRADGAYDLVLRGGEVVQPALETGIRDEHLRPRRASQLDALSEEQLALAELKLASKAWNKGNKGNEADKGSEQGRDSVADVLTKLLAGGDSSGPNSEELQKVLASLQNNLADSQPKPGTTKPEGQQASGQSPGGDYVARSTESADSQWRENTAAATGLSNDSEKEHLVKELDLKLRKRLKVIQKKERQFDLLRGDTNARVKLVKLRDEISKLHQEFAVMLKTRDQEVGVQPQDLQLKVGESVYAEWNSRGAWYPGKIKAHVEQPTAYSILYDDGDAEDQVPASRIRPVNMHEHTASEARSDTASAATGAAASGSTNRFSASTTAAASAARSTPGTKALSVGDSVIANWRGKGKYYPGKVAKVMPDGTFHITYDDGDQESKVPAQRIKQVPKATGYAVGDRVLGAYLGPRGGHGQWYPGTISAGPGPGNTYSIAYDDGDLEDNIPLARIKKLQGDAGEKQEMQITTVIMVQGADGKMQMKKIKANLGDINLSDQKAMARKLEALIKGEDLNTESDIREEVPDQVQDDPKRSTIVRLAATY